MRFLRLSFVMLVTATVMATAAAPAQASMVEALSLDEMTRRSDQIVFGMVMRTETKWDAYGRIVTDATVRVAEHWKGASASQSSGHEIVVRRLGGSIGDLAMKVPGEPGFKTGEEVVLFLRDQGPAELRPVGMAQGVLRIVRTATGVAVTQALHGLSLVRPDGKGGVRHTRPESIPTDLDGLRKAVRASVSVGANRHD